MASGFRLQRRNVLASEAHPLPLTGSGSMRWPRRRERATGRAVAGLIAGQQADFLVFDGASPALAGLGWPAVPGRA